MRTSSFSMHTCNFKQIETNSFELAIKRQHANVITSFSLKVLNITMQGMRRSWPHKKLVHTVCIRPQQIHWLLLLIRWHFIFCFDRRSLIWFLMGRYVYVDSERTITNHRFFLVKTFSEVYSQRHKTPFHFIQRIAERNCTQSRFFQLFFMHKDQLKRNSVDEWMFSWRAMLCVRAVHTCNIFCGEKRNN